MTTGDHRRPSTVTETLPIAIDRYQRYQWLPMATE